MIDDLAEWARFVILSRIDVNAIPIRGVDRVHGGEALRGAVIDLPPSVAPSRMAGPICGNRFMRFGL
jgi:hypothetical protein